MHQKKRVEIDLMVDGLDPVEVESVLSSYFQSATGDAASSRLPTENSRLLIERHPKSGALTFLPGPYFDPSEVDGIRQRITESLRVNQAPKVAGSIGFAWCPVEGSFASHDGLWMLQPAPHDARRPDNFAGGGNPFLLYMRVPWSDDFMVVQRRHAKAVQRWVATMNGLLAAGLSGQPRFTTFHWVLHLDGTDAKSAWEQQYYAIPGFAPIMDDFPPPAPHVPVIAENEYYGVVGQPSNYPLRVPENLSDDLARVERLDEGNLARFLNSGRWRAVSNELWAVSFASWYVAQVAAVEALLPSVTRPRCPECGQEIGPGPTALFKNFLERHAPGSGNRTFLDRLYKVRSGLVHGVGQLASDEAFGMAEPASLQERGQLDQLRRIVAVATVNWLREIAP